MLLLLTFYLYLILTYIYNKNVFIVSVISFLTLGTFVLYKIGNSYTPTYTNVLMVGTLTIFALEKKTRQYFKITMIYITIYLFYLLLISLFQSSSFVSYVNIYRIPFFGFLLGLIVLENSNAGKIRNNLIIHTFYALLFFEVILSFFQHFSPTFSQFFQIEDFEWRGQTITMINSFDKGKNLMLGTFMGVTSFADYLAVSIIAILTFEFNRNSQIAFWKILIFVTAFVSLIFTGIKSPVFLTIIAALVLFYRYKRNYFYILSTLIISIILFLGIDTLIQESGSNLTTGIENPIDRLVGGFVLLSGNMNLIEVTTIGQSIIMIPYVFKNPLFGIGLHSSTGYTMPSGMTLEDYSTTDAQLLFTIAEIGIIGLIIVLLPYLRFVRLTKFNKESKNSLYFILLMFLCLTVVDMGLFSIYFCYLFFLIASATQDKKATE